METTTQQNSQLFALPPDYRLDFGKYKGRKITELPSTYLQWLATEFSGCRHWEGMHKIAFARAIELEYQSRAFTPAQQIIDTGFRSEIAKARREGNKELESELSKAMYYLRRIVQAAKRREREASSSANN